MYRLADEHYPNAACIWVVLDNLNTQLEEFDTSKPHVVKIVLYAAMLSLLVSRDLLDLVTEQADDEIVFPPERWAATFRSYAQLILHELGEYLGYSPPPLLERLIEDAPEDPPATTDLTGDARYRYATEV